jgi:hypothetical protein
MQLLSQYGCIWILIMMVPFLSPEITPNFSIETKQFDLEIQIL